MDNNIGYCGLACILCSAKLNGECEGCMSKGDCDFKLCGEKNSLKGCYECNNTTCEKGLSNNIRAKAFNKAIKEHGKEKVVECLIRNNENDIFYHDPNGGKGSYDKLETEEEILQLLLYGKIQA